MKGRRERSLTDQPTGHLAARKIFSLQRRPQTRRESKHSRDSSGPAAYFPQTIERNEVIGSCAVRSRSLTKFTLSLAEGFEMTKLLDCHFERRARNLSST